MPFGPLTGNTGTNRSGWVMASSFMITDSPSPTTFRSGSSNASSMRWSTSPSPHSRYRNVSMIRSYSAASAFVSVEFSVGHRPWTAVPLRVDDLAQILERNHRKGILGQDLCEVLPVGVVRLVGRSRVPALTLEPFHGPDEGIVGIHQRWWCDFAHQGIEERLGLGCDRDHLVGDAKRTEIVGVVPT